MNDLDLYTLERLSKKTREHILKMSRNGGAFLGSAMSCVDLIIFLYYDFLKISMENLRSPDRNYFFLSKGHAVPALYATLAEFGLLNKDRLENHLKSNDNIYWHPNQNIPSVEFHSGSLGHLLSVAIGVAMDIKNEEKSNKVVVMLGDGELNEGSIWESLQVASAYKLDNLLIIVDRNGIQANKFTEELIPLTPLNMKFETFGCAVRQIDGHNFIDIKNTLDEFPFELKRPSVIIADTIRGKGIKSIENKINKWFAENSDYETLQYLNELHTSK